MIEDGACSHEIDYVTIFLGDSKSQKVSKLHYWFKSYGDFAEWVNFAYWRSFIGKGLLLQPAQQACFVTIKKKIYIYRFISLIYANANIVAYNFFDKYYLG